MKLKEIKESALKSAVLDIYGVRYRALIEENAALALDVWEHVYGAHEKALAKIPREFLNTEASIEWCGKNGFRYSARFNGSLYRGWRPDIRFPFQEDLEGGIKKVFKPVHRFSKHPILSVVFCNRNKVLLEKEEALKTNVEIFCGEMRGNLTLVKTPKQLVEAWPGVEKYLLVGWDAAQPPMRIEKGFLGGLVKAAKTA